MLDTFEIGEIVNVHGVKGALKVRPLTDVPQRFKKLKKIKIEFPKDSPRANLAGEYEISLVQMNGDFVLLTLVGLTDRDKANLYRGGIITIPRAEALKLPKDTYFVGDLIGCKVFEVDKTKWTEGADPKSISTLLGTLTDVLTTGANDAYEVRLEQGTTMYIPALKQVLAKVDIEKGEVYCLIPDGLKEVYLEKNEN